MRYLILILAILALSGSVAEGATLPHGQRVCDLQWMLQGHRPAVFHQGGVNTAPLIHTYPPERRRTCVYGAVTAKAVRSMKYRLGFPARALNGRAGPDFLQILRGKRTRPALYVARAGNRFPITVPALPTSCGQRLIAIEKRELGVHEYGDNLGTIGTATSRGNVHAYQAVTGAFGPGLGGSWCASFQQWSLVQEGYGTIADDTASVFHMTDWSAHRQLLHAFPRVPSLVLFQDQRKPGQGHEGLVILTTAHGFVSIEGNEANGVHELFHDMGYRNPVFLWLPHCS